MPNRAHIGDCMGRQKSRLASVANANCGRGGPATGSERAAAIYTLVETAKLNDIDPQAWLADPLARLVMRDLPAIERGTSRERAPSNVGRWGKLRRDLLRLSCSQFDPQRTSMHLR